MGGVAAQPSTGQSLHKGRTRTSGLQVWASGGAHSWQGHEASLQWQRLRLVLRCPVPYACHVCDTRRRVQGKLCPGAATAAHRGPQCS